MFLLANSLQQTINRIDALLDGWTYGYLVIEDGQAYLELENEDLVPVTEDHYLEAENGDHFQHLTRADLEKKTLDGWPAYAGLLARMKPIEGSM